LLATLSILLATNTQFKCMTADPYQLKSLLIDVPPELPLFSLLYLSVLVPKFGWVDARQPNLHLIPLF